MKKSVLILCLVVAVQAVQGFGFIFTDMSALSQRVTLQSSVIAQWAQQLGYSAEQVQGIMQQIQKFQEYKRQFDQYYGTFNSCYRAIQGGNWEGLATTINRIYLEELARQQGELDETQAAQVRQDAQNMGLVSEASQMSQDEINRTVAALQDTEYYRNNPELRKEVDEYIREMQANYIYQNSYLAKVTAIVKVIQTHNQTITRLEQQNQQLSTGDDQASLVAQIALQNQIAIEQLKLQVETATLNGLLAGHQADGDMTYQRGTVNTSNQQQTRKGVIDKILAPLQDGAAAPKQKR